LIVDATFEDISMAGFVGRVEIFHGGQLLVGTSTDRLGLDLIRSAGRVGYRFTFADVPFAAGRYRVAVSTAPDRFGQPQHTLPAAIEFTVASDTATVGPVAVQVAVEELD
jgi:hypothetical protein